MVHVQLLEECGAHKIQPVHHTAPDCTQTPLCLSLGGDVGTRGSRNRAASRVVVGLHYLISLLASLSRAVPPFALRSLSLKQSQALS